MTPAPTTAGLLGEAIRLLAARCDGAAATDGQGFNKVHAPLGHILANMPMERWTPEQTHKAWKMARWYPGQGRY